MNAERYHIHGVLQFCLNVSWNRCHEPFQNKFRSQFAPSDLAQKQSKALSYTILYDHKYGQLCVLVFLAWIYADMTYARYYQTTTAGNSKTLKFWYPTLNSQILSNSCVNEKNVCHGHRYLSTSPCLWLRICVEMYFNVTSIRFLARVIFTARQSDFGAFPFVEITLVSVHTWFCGKPLAIPPVSGTQISIVQWKWTYFTSESPKLMSK